MFNLPEGGEIPVPFDRLPVLLPEDVVMDGVNSPIKSDLNGAKLNWMAKPSNTKPIPSIPSWNRRGITPVTPARILKRHARPGCRQLLAAG
jgi:hypothetical protein